MKTIAEHLAEQLAEAGVRVVYGLPGGENVEILDAIRRQGIEFVLVKNESSACFMAATSARLTGKIGVALTTLGPGATNAYVGMAHAYLDRDPILLITAQTDPQLLGIHTHQVIDLQAIFRPITKFTTDLTSEDAVSMIHHALHVTKSGCLGPVHLGINNRVALQAVQGTIRAEKSTVAEALDDDVTSIQAILADKKRPVMVVGLGLEPDQPYQELALLAEKLNIPVIDTPKAKGALSATNPLFAGTIGLTRDDPVYEILDESDCILAIGFDVVELVKPWDQAQPLVWIANWANQDPRISCEFEYVGNIKQLLNALSDTLEIQVDDGWGRSRLEGFQRKLQQEPLPATIDKRLLPQEVLQAIRANTPADVIVTTDVGSHKIFTALNWQTQSPNTYFVSNGLSAMGFGLTAAVAAAKTTAQPTICITGDAGLAMVMGELSLLVDYELPVIVVVMNDSALDLIRSAQKRRGRDVFGTEFTNPDYEHIARAYRLDYAQVRSSNECADAIQQAIQSRKPTLIEAMIDPIGYPTTVRS